MNLALYEALRNSRFLIAGPCVIEGEKMILHHAERIAAIAQDLKIPFVFKASFDKANRTSITGYRGSGMEEGLKILAKVKKEFGLAITTDIHESWQAAPVAEVVDILQIPAFLCRQTDLLLSAGDTGKIVNVKKGQFLSGKDMLYAVKKIESTGNYQIILTERGNMFGYNNLIVDFRNIPDMQTFGYPVVMDVTHSTQQPGGLGGKSGGNREYGIYLAKAAAAVGVNGFFFEVHQNPEEAFSDGPNMIYLDTFREILQTVWKII